MPNTLRRLIDLPGMRDLEYEALLKPRHGDDDARGQFPALDETSRVIFGLTADEAEAAPRPDGWDDIDCRPEPRQVAQFEAEGWDVTDDKRRHLRTLKHFSTQLWLAIRGVAGTVPFQAEAEPELGGSKLAAEAARFRRDRR